MGCAGPRWRFGVVLSRASSSRLRECSRVGAIGGEFEEVVVAVEGGVEELKAAGVAEEAVGNWGNGEGDRGGPAEAGAAIGELQFDGREAERITLAAPAEAVAGVRSEGRAESLNDCEGEDRFV